MGEDEEGTIDSAYAAELQPEDVTPAEAQPIETQESEETPTWVNQMLEATHQLTEAVTNLSARLLPETKPKEPEPQPAPPPEVNPAPTGKVRPNRKRRLF